MLTKAVNDAKKQQEIWQAAKIKAANAGLVMAVCANPACNRVGVLTMKSATELPSGIKALSRCAACKEKAYCCKQCQVLSVYITGL